MLVADLTDESQCCQTKAAQQKMFQSMYVQNACKKPNNNRSAL